MIDMTYFRYAKTGCQRRHVLRGGGRREEDQPLDQGDGERAVQRAGGHADAPAQGMERQHRPRLRGY